MDGNPRGAGPRELPDQPVHRPGHQMHVDGGRAPAVGAAGQRFTHHRPEGEVRDEVVVHHVEVDEIRSRPSDRAHLVAEACEIGGEEGRRDPRRARIHSESEGPSRAATRRASRRDRRAFFTG